MLPAKRLIGYGIRKQFWDLWKIIVASVMMFGVVQIMNIFPWNIGILLTEQIIVGVIVYIILGFVLKIEPQTVLLKAVAKMVWKE